MASTCSTSQAETSAMELEKVRVQREAKSIARRSEDSALLHMPSKFLWHSGNVSLPRLQGAPKSFPSPFFIGLSKFQAYLVVARRECAEKGAGTFDEGKGGVDEEGPLQCSLWRSSGYVVTHSCSGSLGCNT